MICEISDQNFVYYVNLKGSKSKVTKMEFVCFSVEIEISFVMQNTFNTHTHTHTHTQTHTHTHTHTTSTTTTTTTTHRENDAGHLHGFAHLQHGYPHCNKIKTFIAYAQTICMAYVLYLKKEKKKNINNIQLIPFILKSFPICTYLK